MQVLYLYCDYIHFFFSNDQPLEVVIHHRGSLSLGCCLVATLDLPAAVPAAEEAVQRDRDIENRKKWMNLGGIAAGKKI